MACGMALFRNFLMLTNQDKASNSEWTIVFICWIIASVSTLGSLFFSEISNYY